MKKSDALRICSSPIFFGMIAGILAVLAQPVFQIQPPQAYGICTICHARDLFTWLGDVVLAVKVEFSDTPINYPLLTIMGLILGAFISSKMNGEYRFIRNEDVVKMFILGVIIANFGLIILSCPTRLVLRFAYGDPFAFLGVIGLFLGIAAGVLFLRWRSRF
jgi:hypothetical protein